MGKLNLNQPPQAPVASLARSQPLQDWIGRECVRKRCTHLRQVTDPGLPHAPRKGFVPTHPPTLAATTGDSKRGGETSGARRHRG